MFGDQQLVTGLAILGSVFTQLNKGISAYHWQIVVYLAWFSSLTHLSLLTVLRSYLREHSGIRNWRLILMAITLGMLLAALIPTGKEDFNAYSWGQSLGGVPAICYFSELRSSDADSEQGFAMTISMVILIVSYIAKAIKLSHWASATSQHCLNALYWNRAQWLLNKTYPYSKTSRFRFFWRSLYTFIFALHINVRMLAEISQSMIVEVNHDRNPLALSSDADFASVKIVWLVFALVWGSMRLSRVRVTIQDEYLPHPHLLPREDDAWSFGQCIAVILLVFPLISIGEGFLGESYLSKPRRRWNVIILPDSCRIARYDSIGY